jgi:hypothetical protein
MLRVDASPAFDCSRTFFPDLFVGPSELVDRDPETAYLTCPCLRLSPCLRIFEPVSA